jgi:hypothetical protein
LADCGSPAASPKARLTSRRGWGSRVVGLFGRFAIRARSEFVRASMRPRRRIASRTAGAEPLHEAPHARESTGRRHSQRNRAAHLAPNLGGRDWAFENLAGGELTVLVTERDASTGGLFALIAKFYRSPDGSEPVNNFINTLPIPERASVAFAIELLNELTDQRPHLPFPHSSQVAGELRELRCPWAQALPDPLSPLRAVHRIAPHFPERYRGGSRN